MECLLGVYAGNTKTVALVSDVHGKVIGSGKGDGSLEKVGAAMQAALTQAGCSPEDVASACVATAGAVWPQDCAIIAADMKSRGFARKVHVMNSAMAALLATGPATGGVAIVCGTYANTAARNSVLGETREWVGGDWQQDGGATSIGKEALRAVFRSELGLEPETSLTAALLGHFGFSSIEEMLHATTKKNARHITRPDTAAATVLSHAAAGDAVAMSIVEREADRLSDYAKVAARKVGLNLVYHLTLTGGVFRHPSGLLRELIAQKMAIKSKIAIFNSQAEQERVAGALYRAYEAHSGMPSFYIRQTVERTMPGPDFFKPAQA